MFNPGIPFQTGPDFRFDSPTEYRFFLEGKIGSVSKEVSRRIADYAIDKIAGGDDEVRRRIVLIASLFAGEEPSIEEARILEKEYFDGKVIDWTRESRKDLAYKIMIKLENEASEKENQALNWGKTLV